MKRGVYDREKAVKLFMYLADEASKRYSKQFGDGKTHTADVPTRMLLAKMLRDRFESERKAMGIPAGAMPRINPAARTKTWKLGEYGGNIKAQVNQSGTAIEIFSFNDDDAIGEKRLFRWPLDKFNMEMYLNELTTSYYASKIIEWIDSVTKGTSMNPAPSGYHYMPDGRLMADSAHSNPARRGKKYKARRADLKYLAQRVKDPESAYYGMSVKELTKNPAQSDPNLAYKKEYGWTFVDFLKKRLIPDLRESGMDATANDYQRGISLYRDKKGVLPITSSMNYLKYLRETLIPDLKASGSDSTAADFERMYKMVLYTMDRHPKSRDR
jgi:hypothetical protein